MPKNFIYKTFNWWLKRNWRHFNFQPVISKRRKNYFQCIFRGISPSISLLIGKHQAMVTAEYKGECWDIIAEFDVWEKRDSRGYYFFSGCSGNDRRYYKSRRELWIEHCFEPLIEWTNYQFSRNTWICFFSTDKSPIEGITWCKLLNDDDEIREARSNPCLYKVIPLSIKKQRGKNGE